MKLVSVLIAGVAMAALSGAVQAADLPSRRAPAPVAMAAAPVFTWAGSYVGVNLGAWINGSRTSFAGIGGLGHGAGFLGGLTMGHNWDLRNGFVVGLETDLDYRARADVNGAGLVQTTTSSGYLGTARVRAGVALDRALIYVTGGLAYGNPASPRTIVAPWAGYAGARNGNDDKVQLGWALGAGVEYALTPNWSVKAEYIYADLGSRSLRYDSFPGFVSAYVPVRSKEHVARLGLNYRFTSWGAPVVARY